MTLKYFKYELKKSIWPMIILTIMGSLLYIPQLIAYRLDTRPSLINITLFLINACLIVPIYEFSFLTKKRSVDYYYSLPVKRSSIVLFKLIAGFIKILISYTVVFFLGLLIIVLKENSYYILYFFVYYLVSIFVAMFLYSFISFIFVRANTIIDGILFTILINVAVLLLVLSIDKLMYDLFTIDFIVNVADLTFFQPFMLIRDFFEELIYYGSVSMVPLRASLIGKYHLFIIWFLIAIASVFGLLYSTKVDKAERAEQISNSYFGYRILIPLITVTLIYATNINPFEYISYFVIFAVIMGGILVLYIIYQRTFKLKLKYWIIFTATAIFGILLNIIFK